MFTLDAQASFDLQLQESFHSTCHISLSKGINLHLEWRFFFCFFFSSCVFYRNDVSRFDIEAGQVVVVAIIFQGANLQSCRSVWQKREDVQSDGKKCPYNNNYNNNNNKATHPSGAAWSPGWPVLRWTGKQCPGPSGCRCSSPLHWCRSKDDKE